MIKSPFTPRAPRDFRILLFYPNLHMSALMPQSIGIFTAILKQEGYTLDLFDCTYYQDIDVIIISSFSKSIIWIKLAEERYFHIYLSVLSSG